MFTSAVESIYLYFGLFILLSCLLGNLLNIIIFTSLKTFRETSCAFYLTVASFVNIFQCLAGLFSRILSVVFNIDLTKSSTILCKTRISVLVTAALISLTAVSFAAIDQYASVTVRWRHLANRHWALRLMLVTVVFWAMHGVSVAFFTEIFTNEWTVMCGFSNVFYRRYYSDFVVPILFGFLPVGLRTVFGLAAMFNVRSLPRRQVPIVRRRRDQQLTMMVLVEVLFDNVFTLIYILYYLYSSQQTFTDRVERTRDQMISALTTCLYYSTFAVSDPSSLYLTIHEREIEYL